MAPMTDPHSVRVACPADSEAVGALLLASFSSLLSGHYDREMLDMALPLLTRANTTLLASGSYYVAESEAGALVGCGGWSTAPPGSGDIVQGEGHVRHFAVHPSWSGRGIGTSLLARCFVDAGLVVRTLYCYSSLNAEPFYKARGFGAIGSIDVPSGPGLKFRSILMKCELARPAESRC
jgi:N-acetylglutamate synthase-like GNAT family acetyltransferase